MSSWLTSFRDEFFNSHPILYTLLIVVFSFYVLQYVYTYEKRTIEEKRKEQYRPFK
jgi:hypothetical protein